MTQGQVGAGACGENLETGLSRISGVGGSDSSPFLMPAWTTVFTWLDVRQNDRFILDTGRQLTGTGAIGSILCANDKHPYRLGLVAFCGRSRSGGALRPCAVAYMGGSVVRTAQPVPQGGFLHEQAFTACRLLSTPLSLDHWRRWLSEVLSAGAARHSEKLRGRVGCRVPARPPALS